MAKKKEPYIEIDDKGNKMYFDENRKRISAIGYYSRIFAKEPALKINDMRAVLK